jgi:hypothetical protein
MTHLDIPMFYLAYSFRHFEENIDVATINHVVILS